MIERDEAKQDTTNRSRKVTVRFTPAEYKTIDTGFQKTTFRKLSDYFRSLLLGRKITVYEGNKSLDEFMEEMILLRTELNKLGNNFNQVARKINASKETWELKALGSVSSSMQQKLLIKVDEIKKQINQFSDKWLQSL